MFFKVGHKVAVDDVFKDFTWNRCKGDGWDDSFLVGVYLHF